MWPQKQKLECAATRQGMLAATGSWEKPGTECLLESPEGARPRQHLDFRPVILVLDFWSSQL